MYGLGGKAGLFPSVSGTFLETKSGILALVVGQIYAPFLKYNVHTWYASIGSWSTRLDFKDTAVPRNILGKICVSRNREYRLTERSNSHQVARQTQYRSIYF